MRLLQISLISCVVFALCLTSQPCEAAFIYNGGNYQQDFNVLANTGELAAWTNDSTILGWFSTETSYSIGNGSDASSGQYSYGTTASSDRALGSLTTNGNSTISYALQLQNNTGLAILQYTLSYTGEQWRGGGQARQNSLTFDYRIDSTAGINPINGSAVTELTFSSPSTATGALDGNAVANRETLTHTVTGLVWNPGEYLTLRWTDNKVAGANHGLAIDDLDFSTQVIATPEPASLFAVGVVPLWLCSRWRKRRAIARESRAARPI